MLALTWMGDQHDNESTRASEKVRNVFNLGCRLMRTMKNIRMERRKELLDEQYNYYYPDSPLWCYLWRKMKLNFHIYCLSIIKNRWLAQVKPFTNSKVQINRSSPLRSKSPILWRSSQLVSIVPFCKWEYLPKVLPLSRVTPKLSHALQLILKELEWLLEDLTITSGFGIFMEWTEIWTALESLSHSQETLSGA